MANLPSMKERELKYFKISAFFIIHMQLILIYIYQNHLNVLDSHNTKDLKSKKTT